VSSACRACALASAPWLNRNELTDLLAAGEEVTTDSHTQLPAA